METNLTHKAIRGPLIGVLTAVLVLGGRWVVGGMSAWSDGEPSIGVYGIVFVSSIGVLGLANLIIWLWHRRRGTAHIKTPRVLKRREEALSLVTVFFIGLGILPALVDIDDAEYRSLALIDLPSIVAVLGSVALFMLILNNGHAVRWLYPTPNKALVLLNHHSKSPAAWIFAGVLMTGVGFVQVVDHLDDPTTLVPSIAVMILPIFYANLYALHHLVCRVLIYTRSENRLAYLPDFKSSLLGIGSTLVALWVVFNLDTTANDALGHAFRVFTIELWQPSGVQDPLVRERIPELFQTLLFTWGTLFGVTVLLGYGFSKLKAARRPTPVAWYMEAGIVLLASASVVAMVLTGQVEIPEGALDSPDRLLMLQVVSYFGIVLALAGGFVVIYAVYLWFNVVGRWRYSGILEVELGKPHAFNYFHAVALGLLSLILAVDYGGELSFGLEEFGVTVLIVGALISSQLSQARLKAIIRTQTRELERDKQALQVLDKQKTHFFQTISHELRTPLTLIMTPLEASVRRYPADSELGIASNNAKRLLRLVNQLLDFQKVSAGRFELKPLPLRLPQLLDRCADYFRSAAAGRDIHFEIRMTDEQMRPVKEGVVAEVDGDAFEKIVMNYLSNALKYTPSNGRIILGLLLYQERIRIYVTDSGPGISRDNQEVLFKLFSQVDGSTTRAYEGTGLGLALVKELAEEMNGKVGVDSEVGQGSTFWVEFSKSDKQFLEESFEGTDKSWMTYSAQEGEGASAAAPSLEEALTDTAETRVLVVDDNQDMRHLIQRVLMDAGHQVVVAVDGEHGLEVAREARPDLIVSDWMMPKVSGPEMVHELREDAMLRGTPIVMLTARSDEESKLAGTEVGADAFLGKPFKPEELTGVVRNLIQLKAGEKEIARLNEYLTESVCKRYLPPDLVQEILDGQLSLEEPAELREITVLFSDLKGFTSTSEKLGPEGISTILNEYLSRMNDIIFEHGGTIDKFIGDAIMVMFGAPKAMSSADQSERAVACAKAMHSEMERLCQGWRELGADHLCMRIGIHQGPAVVGNFGSARRSDYTCIGPTVNLAARIESACEPRHVFVSETVAEGLSRASTEVAGEYDLKGVDGKQRLYRAV